MMTMTLKSSFSSAHLYHQPAWSEEQNKATFGRCFTEHGHGHNYTLELSFFVDQEKWQTKKDEYLALLFNLTDKLDHQHLNFDIAEFKKEIPTTENIALYFLNELKKTVSEKEIQSVRLYELDNLWTEIKP
jgi:6-pyruvoyltetrahydropterin/6-carboxytetrahydropterin synthase